MSSNMIIDGNGGLTVNGVTFNLRELVILIDGKLCDVAGNILTDIDILTPVQATVVKNALFYGGYYSGSINSATLLTNAATLVQAESTVGTARQSLAGANV